MTESELVQALLDTVAKAEAGPDDAFTTAQWSDMLGLSQGRTRTYLQRALTAGAMEVVHVVRENMAGHLQPRPAYRLKAQP